MKRRDFLARLLAGATGAALAATLDLDKLLWVPGAKTIFLPTVQPMRLRADWGSGMDYTGISMRVIRQYDLRADRFPTKLDVIYGIGTVRPELTARLTSLTTEFPAA